MIGEEVMVLVVTEFAEACAVEAETSSVPMLDCKIFSDSTDRSTGLRCVGLLRQNFQHTSVVHTKSTLKLIFAEKET